jgi:hypothetical protein
LLFAIYNIKTVIKKTAIEIYCRNKTVNNKEPEIGELDEIIELVAFLFEDYHTEFDERGTPHNLTVRNKHTEWILLISWTSLEVLNDLRNLKAKETVRN